MLMPKRVKYRKQMRGRMRGYSKGGTTVAFGEYGLKAIDRGWITNRQIEAARVAMTRKIKRGGKVWINIFPDKPITKKPAETRMGSGKGNPEGWVAVVKPGRVMFELAGVDEDLAKDAMRLAGHKLPIKTKFVTREGAEAVVKASEAHNLKDDELLERLQQAARGAVRACASSTPPASSRTPPGMGAVRRDVARLLTVAKERGIDLETRTEGLTMADEEKNEKQTEETGPEEPRPEPRRPEAEEPRGRGDSGGGAACRGRRGSAEEAPAERGRRRGR